MRDKIEKILNNSSIILVFIFSIWIIPFLVFADITLKPTEFVGTYDGAGLVRACPSFQCKIIKYGGICPLTEVLYKTKDWYKVKFTVRGDYDETANQIEECGHNHGRMLPKSSWIETEGWMPESVIPSTIRALFVSEEKKSDSVLFELQDNELIRECPLFSCTLSWMGTWGGIAVLKEKNGEWYRVIVVNNKNVVDTAGAEGWIHGSLVPENVKEIFIASQQPKDQTSQIEDQTHKEEAQSEFTLFLFFSKNKSFQNGLVITFISIILLLSIFLLRKRIKGVFRLEWSDINLRKIKINRQSFIFSTVVAIGIMVGLIGISYGAIYYQSSKSIEKAEQLTKAEKYNEAIGELESVSDLWLVQHLGLKKQEISDKTEEVRQLLKDKTEYNQGVEEFNKENWETAKDILSKVSEISPYYRDARNKIEEAQNNIFQQKITEAIARATEESKRILIEAKSRVEAEAQQSQAKTAELEQKIKELQQKQPSQGWSGYRASEIVEELGKYIVGVACADYFGNVSSGSGIIIGSANNNESIILTNYHVIENADVYAEYPCVVGYSSNPIYGFTDFYYATPVYFPSVILESDMKLIDFYFLNIKQEVNPDSLKIIYGASLILGDNRKPISCSVNEIKVGEEVVVLGYPAIGGEYLTATEGIISGLEGKYYLTTSAKIDQGSSGGGVFLKSSGCLIGMPTFVILGKIESLARVINMAVLERDYLSRIWSSSVTSPPLDLSQKAHGTITVYNAYSTSPQLLVATTRFVSDDGKLFRTPVRVTIPGGKTEGGKFVPGEIDVEIVADQPGSGYELNCSKIYPCTFTIPGFAGTDRYTKIYAKAFSSIKQ